MTDTDDDYSASSSESRWSIPHLGVGESVEHGSGEVGGMFSAAWTERRGDSVCELYLTDEDARGDK